MLLLLPSHCLRATLHLLPHLLLLLLLVGHVPASSAAALQHTKQQQDVVTSYHPPSNNAAASSSDSLPPLDAHVIAAIASAAAAALSARESLLPETLNSQQQQQHRVHVTGGPPLIVGSEGAQRFFDRLHGYVEVKPVVQRADHISDNGNSDSDAHGDHDSALNGQTATTSGGSNSITTTKKIASRHDTTSKTTASNAADDNQNAAASNPMPVAVSIDTAPATPQKNWILHSATITRQHSDGTETVEPIVGQPPPAVDAAAAAAALSRQMMFASLSDRVIGQLAAGNPWVNWTQSSGPVIVHSLDNLPIGQMPFVVVVPTSAPPVVPSADQKPPRRGWLSFLRPWNRIYGEGTESKFPPLLEGVLQRIQHYFSVYKYQDESRPQNVGQLPSSPAADNAAAKPVAATVPQKPQADEVIAPAAAATIVQHGIEIESLPPMTTTTMMTTTATPATVVANNGDDASLSDDGVRQTTTTTEEIDADKLGETTSSANPLNKYGLERLNEITETAKGPSDTRRNDKISKIEQINRI